MSPLENIKSVAWAVVSSPLHRQSLLSTYIEGIEYLARRAANSPYSVASSQRERDYALEKLRILAEPPSGDGNPFFWVPEERPYPGKWGVYSLEGSRNREHAALLELKNLWAESKSDDVQHVMPLAEGSNTLTL
jgi:hypothetical protein